MLPRHRIPGRPSDARAPLPVGGCDDRPACSPPAPPAVGSAESNWCQRSGCQPDRSDRNLVEGNDIAGTTAEAVDIKACTSDGVLRTIRDATTVSCDNEAGDGADGLSNVSCGGS